MDLMFYFKSRIKIKNNNNLTNAILIMLDFISNIQPYIHRFKGFKYHILF